MAIKSLEPVYFTPPPQRFLGYAKGLWKDSPSPPSPPDPIATANAQGAANIDAARVTTALNRANQVTPWGNLTWSRGGNDWNEQGYNQALQLYNEQLGNYNKALSNFNNSQNQNQGYGSGYDGLGYQPQHRPQQQFTGTAPTAPKKEDFGYNQDAWTSTVTLDPRIQSLLDSSLATSQGLQTAIDNSLSSTTNTLSQPLNTPDSINIGNIRNGVEGRYTDLQPSLQGSTDLATLGRS